MNKDVALFNKIREDLFTAVVGDVMDLMGLTHQFLPPRIQPLKEGMTVVGRAMTVLEEDANVLDEGSPFGLMFDALDDLKVDEVYLASGSSGAYALWGGLMSTRATKLGAAGAVLNGYHRDTQEIRGMSLPVFSWGGYSQDQRRRGKVVDYRCPLELLNGTAVNPGDIVFGDVDGVVIVPQDRESEVIEAALEKVTGEDQVRQAIDGGMSTKDAFKRYGIM
jgi:regulator of RNase E activity RraA